MFPKIHKSLEGTLNEGRANVRVPKAASGHKEQRLKLKYTLVAISQWKLTFTSSSVLHLILSFQTGGR